MDVSQYFRKAATDALNDDTEFVRSHGKTAYLGAQPEQVDQFLASALAPEEIYHSNQRRMQAEASVKILANRLAAMEKRLGALEKKLPEREQPSEPAAAKPIRVELLDV
jgi:hypothetical protein